MARELDALGAQPVLDTGDQRRAELATGGKTLLSAAAVDAALDLEQRVAAADRLQRQRRDGRRLALAKAPCTPPRPSLW
jgi:hypothetical protein